MITDNAIGYGQPQTRATRGTPGREKRIPDPLQIVGVNPLALITDLYPHRLPVKGGGDPQPSVGCGQGRRSILEQVENNLLQPNPIGHNRR